VVLYWITYLIFLISFIIKNMNKLLNYPPTDSLILFRNFCSSRHNNINQSEKDKILQTQNLTVPLPLHSQNTASALLQSPNYYFSISWVGKLTIWELLRTCLILIVFNILNKNSQSMSSSSRSFAEGVAPVISFSVIDIHILFTATSTNYK